MREIIENYVPTVARAGTVVARKRVRTEGVEAKMRLFVWKKTERGRSAVDVASWGLLSIDVGLSSRLWTHEAHPPSCLDQSEFGLNSTALAQPTVVAQLRSIGRHGKSGKGYIVWG
jgi:hypothetical protein